MQEKAPWNKFRNRIQPHQTDGRGICTIKGTFSFNVNLDKRVNEKVTLRFPAVLIFCLVMGGRAYLAGQAERD